MSHEPLVVLHSSRRWLKQTKTWIYQQLQWLPSNIEAHVVCEATANLDQFPWRRLHTLEGAPRWQKAFESVLRRAGQARFRYPVRVARRIGAQVLHSHFGPEGFRELAVARAARLRHVVTFYGYDVTRLPQQSPIWRERYLQLFRHVDRVLCEGPHMRDELVRLGCPSTKALVHHLGADLSLFRYAPRRYRPGEELKVLIAGSFREKKGFPYAFRALGKLLYERPNLQLRVDVVGDASSAPGEQAEKRAIERAVAEADLTRRVHFFGYLPYTQLMERAYQSHVFLSPSVRAADGDTEGGAPVTIIELAASGMPIVSTSHCDIPNVLRGAAAQYLAPERDVEALASRLGRLLDDASSWPEMLDETRRDVEARFDARTQGLALAAHYRELVQT